MGQLNSLIPSEWVRQALIRSLEADGVNLGHFVAVEG
jgi:hypothetical protein